MSSLISPPGVSFYSYNGQDQKKGQTFLKLFLINLIEVEMVNWKYEKSFKIQEVIEDAKNYSIC